MYAHFKSSDGYHEFVPRCPECEGAKEQPYFVKCDPANNETTFTTENSRKCAAPFHVTEPSPTLGEPAPIRAYHVIRQALKTHWLTGIECDHDTKRDFSMCACGLWTSGNESSVGAAVEAWINHVFEIAGASQQAAPLAESTEREASALKEGLEIAHRNALSPFSYAGTPECRKIEVLLGLSPSLLEGTYACPICGCATPHAHSAEDIAEWRAHDDEMTFVLLGRDAAAPEAIYAWIAERIRLGKNAVGDAQIVEAFKCARLMAETRKEPQ